MMVVSVGRLHVWDGTTFPLSKLEGMSNILFRFWEAVHSMALEDKRKLLQFTTGRFVFKPHIFVATFDPRAF